MVRDIERVCFGLINVGLAMCSCPFCEHGEGGFGLSIFQSPNWDGHRGLLKNEFALKPGHTSHPNYLFVNQNTGGTLSVGLCYVE